MKHPKRPYVVYEADEDAEYDAEYTKLILSTLKTNRFISAELPENTKTIDEVGDVKIDQVYNRFIYLPMAVWMIF